jgi:UDP-3-O-[3-hydroxymyristoyl] glucosamine N-acyltransferase
MITLALIVERVNGRLDGNADTPIFRISSIKDAREGDITFLADMGLRGLLSSCEASAILVGPSIDPSETSVPNLVFVENPFAAYVTVAEIFDSLASAKPVSSPLAFIAQGADVSPQASVGAYAYIGSSATIARGVTVHPFAFIGNDVFIDEDSTIYPHAVLYNGVRIGKRTIIHAGSIIGSDGFGYFWDGTKHRKIPQLGSVEIGDDVEIGANVTIDRAALGKTVIGRGTKIDNLVQIAHNVTIGDNSIVVAQVGIAGSTTIGRNVILAGQVGVNDHVTVGDNVRAGGQTGITKDVPANSTIFGTPHMLYREWARLQVYVKKLPGLYEKVKRLEEKLPREDKE